MTRRQVSIPISRVLEHICNVCLFPDNEKETQGGREGTQNIKMWEQNKCQSRQKQNVGMTDEREQALNRYNTRRVACRHCSWWHPQLTPCGRSAAKTAVHHYSRSTPLFAFIYLDRYGIYSYQHLCPSAILRAIPHLLLPIVPPLLNPLEERQRSIATCLIVLPNRGRFAIARLLPRREIAACRLPSSPSARSTWGRRLRRRCWFEPTSSDGYK